MSAFGSYVGIDYSGAETPTSSLLGLRIYVAEGAGLPSEVPPPGPKRYWTRRGVAEWLEHRLLEDRPALVGIDHAFSFPRQYFERYRLAHDWTAFLEDFRRHWPTDDDHVYVDFVRDGVCGNGAARHGEPDWWRLTDAGGAKPVFQFDVTGQVAKSTHAGLPWLLYLREHCREHVHFWPFDGWDVPAGRSVVAEVYPALWRHRFPREDRSQDQHDAYSVARWMRNADDRGILPALFHPCLEESDRKTAEIEGWILGVA